MDKLEVRPAVAVLGGESYFRFYCFIEFENKRSPRKYVPV